VFVIKFTASATGHQDLVPWFLLLLNSSPGNEVTLPVRHKTYLRHQSTYQDDLKLFLIEPLLNKDHCHGQKSPHYAVLPTLIFTFTTTADFKTLTLSAP
jgi:hypothetical protein